MKSLLVQTGVAVEKLDLSENRPKRSDQKCIGDRRKSFIGHPDATHFWWKFCERVFQQLRLFTSTTATLPAAKPLRRFSLPPPTNADRSSCVRKGDLKMMRPAPLAKSPNQRGGRTKYTRKM